jgi:hypothetical protein
MTASNHVFSIFSFVGFFLLLFPLYWRIKGTHVIGCLSCTSHEIELVYSHVLLSLPSRIVPLPRCSFLHCVDRTWMPQSLHKLDHVGWDCDRKGISVV